MSSGQKAWADEEEANHEAAVSKAIRDSMKKLASSKDYELVRLREQARSAICNLNKLSLSRDGFRNIDVLEDFVKLVFGD